MLFLYGRKYKANRSSHFRAIYTLIYVRTYKVVSKHEAYLSRPGYYRHGRKVTQFPNRLWLNNTQYVLSISDELVVDQLIGRSLLNSVDCRPPLTRCGGGTVSLFPVTPDDSSSMQSNGALSRSCATISEPRTTPGADPAEAVTTTPAVDLVNSSQNVRRNCWLMAQ